MQEYRSAEVVTPQSQASTSNDSLGRFSILVGSFVTVLMVVGMIADNQQVMLALLCGLSFFTFLVVFVVLVLSGQLSAMVINHDKEKTAREQNWMQYEVYMRETPQVGLVDLPQLPAEEAREEPVRNFIAARPTATPHLKVAADEYVMRLFADGKPDPMRILPEESKAPDRVQAKKPTPDVLEYLLSLEILRGGGKGEDLFFNQKQYPTLVECRQAIKYGLPLRKLQEKT